MALAVLAAFLVVGQAAIPSAQAAESADKQVASLNKTMLPVWVSGTPEQLQDGQAPKTPAGLPRCFKGGVATRSMPNLQGETIRYVVDVDGLSLGTVDFKIERKGTFQGGPVIEYRSLFKLDSLVATFVPVEGRAATLVSEGEFWPRKAMNKYKLANDEIEESMTYLPQGRGVSSKRVKSGQRAEETRNFPTTVQDFVSGFYLLRRVAPTAESCAIIYGNQRAFTVWVKPEGQEQVKTPVGLKLADKYEIRYGSDKSAKALTGHVWLGVDGDRLPYKAEIDGPHKVEARVYLYQPGTGGPSPSPSSPSSPSPSSSSSTSTSAD